MLARASQTFEYSTGISIAKRSDATQLDESSADGGTTGDQELEQYLMLLLGLQRLLIRERQLLVDVVPKARHNDIFTKLSQSSVDMVVKDAEVDQLQLMYFIINCNCLVFFTIRRQSPAKFLKTSLAKNGLLR